ncbi:DUF4957 domain-containing protein [soil metagenome]
MKYINQITLKNIFFTVIILSTVMIACKKTDDLGEAPRLFRPVLKDPLESNGNWIKASWQAIKGSASYTAQVSRDSFKTIAATITADTNYVLFENLAYDKLYQVQVTANATDPAHNSNISFLGEIKTARFPTILNVPTSAEVNDEAVKVTWTTGGAVVTDIKILLATDSSVVKSVTLSPMDVANQYAIVAGLNGSTSYIIYLYSGTTVRGWADFTTKVPLSGNLIDLRNITGRPSVLADTIPLIASGSTVVLKRGETYEIATSINLDKSIKFIGGTDLLEPAQPIIYMPANFNIAAGSVIDSIVFTDVTIRGSDYASKYCFNINQDCSIGTLKFESCLAEIMRGLVRTQSKPVLITNFTVNNCIIDSIAGYGVLTVDVTSSKVDNIKITNSTIYKAEKILTSRNNSNSVIIENCTFNEAPRGGNYFIDYSISASNEVALPVSFKFNIIGSGKSNSGNTDVRGYRLGANSVMDVSSVYVLSDYISTNATGPLPNVIPYARSSTDVWQDPLNGNFKIIDNLFPGRNTTGDPRWRP